MKTFDIPDFYKSPLIAAVKHKRRQDDKLKKDFSPTKLDFGPVKILLARHFGFCYGVENAIEIAFKTVKENPGKRIFLLSEMIHNPQVNNDLRSHGVEFIMDTMGKPYIPWEELKSDDIVIIPAFGTTLETEALLKDKGIDPVKYNTTCPFVEKVWNRSEQIGKKGYSIIIHGKPGHEETRATFSHSQSHAPSLVIRDMQEAKCLKKYLGRSIDPASFYRDFENQYSEGFDPMKDLQQIGVVNQTTMLASDTQAIASFLKLSMEEAYPGETSRFADTRDTLCYATNDNQSAVSAMLETEADLALIVGGYNSSNTSHLVELCEEKLPVYFISDQHKLFSKREVAHFDLHSHSEKVTQGYLPEKESITVLLSSGASCPDSIVESVIDRILSFFPEAVSKGTYLEQFQG